MFSKIATLKSRIARKNEIVDTISAEQMMSLIEDAAYDAI